MLQNLEVSSHMVGLSVCQECVDRCAASVVLVSKVKSVLLRHTLQLCTLAACCHTVMCVQQASESNVYNGEQGCGMLEWNSNPLLFAGCCHACHQTCKAACARCMQACQSGMLCCCCIAAHVLAYHCHTDRTGTGLWLCGRRWWI